MNQLLIDPPSGIEISTASFASGAWQGDGNPITLSCGSGTSIAQTTINVRLSSSASAGAYNQDIIITHTNPNQPPNDATATAKTMAALQKFNGTVSWICYETFKHQPTYFTAQQARKLNEIKVEKGKDTKKQILQWVLDNCPDFSVEYTHKGNPRPKYFDIADAIVVAKAGLK